MIFSHKQFQRIFWVCFGLFAGSAFCMKWMEGDFISQDSKFSIIGLEISYSREKVQEVLAGLNDKGKTILSYHLYFDFAFMTGVYLGIMSLCMMARYKQVNVIFKNLLLVLTLLQIIAFVCDITENVYLLSWLKNSRVGDGFAAYHLVVVIKWSVALTGVLAGIIFSLRPGAAKH